MLKIAEPEPEPEMTMPLPCNELCHKCGNDGISRKFYTKGSRIDSDDYGVCKNKYAQGQCHQYKVYREHIDNTCQCCSYRWQSLPISKSKLKLLKATSFTISVMTNSEQE
jgi:hypothetical protein